MYTIDVDEIYGYIGKRRMTRKELSSRLKITENTLRKYLNNPDDMPYGIAVEIPVILDIPEEEAKRIFFKKKLS
jgi:hypothetical protein